MFYLINLTLNLMAATHFERMGTGATKDGESCAVVRKTPLRNILQVDWIIGNKS